MSPTEQLLATAAGVHYVEIDGTGIEQGRTYTDKKDGLVKPLTGRQNGYLWQGDRYPIQISVDIPQGAGPYRPGLYVITGPMFAAGEYGRVNYKGMRNASLISVADAAQALAALALEETGEVVNLKAAAK
jgi:Helix-destabilising protein